MPLVINSEKYVYDKSNYQSQWYKLYNALKKLPESTFIREQTVHNEAKMGFIEQRAGIYTLGNNDIKYFASTGLGSCYLVYFYSEQGERLLIHWDDTICYLSPILSKFKSKSLKAVILGGNTTEVSINILKTILQEVASATSNLELTIEFVSQKIGENNIYSDIDAPAYYADFLLRQADLLSRKIFNKPLPYDVIIQSSVVDLLNKVGNDTDFNFLVFLASARKYQSTDITNKILAGDFIKDAESFYTAVKRVFNKNSYNQLEFLARLNNLKPPYSIRDVAINLETHQVIAIPRLRDNRPNLYLRNIRIYDIGNNPAPYIFDTTGTDENELAFSSMFARKTYMYSALESKYRDDPRFKHAILCDFRVKNSEGNPEQLIYEGMCNFLQYQEQQRKRNRLSTLPVKDHPTKLLPFPNTESVTGSKITDSEHLRKLFDAALLFSAISAKEAYGKFGEFLDCCSPSATMYYDNALMNRGAFATQIARAATGKEAEEWHNNAIANYKSLIERGGERLIDAYKNIANTYYEKDDFKTARNYYESALDLLSPVAEADRLRSEKDCKLYAEIVYQLGVTYGRLGLQYPNTGYEFIALAHLRYAVILGPNQVDYLINYGYALLKVQDSTTALVQFELCITLKPNVQTYEGYGVALLQLKRLEAAIAAFDKALTYESKHVNVRYNRGLLFGQQQQYKKALADLDVVRKVQPNYPNLTKVYNDLEMKYKQQIGVEEFANQKKLKMELELREAAAEGNEKKLKALIAANVNVNAAGTDSKLTALHRAVNNHHIGCIKLLVAAKADWTIKAKDESPFELAKRLGYHETVAIFTGISLANTNEENTGLQKH